MTSLRGMVKLLPEDTKNLYLCRIARQHLFWRDPRVCSSRAFLLQAQPMIIGWNIFGLVNFKYPPLMPEMFGGVFPALVSPDTRLPLYAREEDLDRRMFRVSRRWRIRRWKWGPLALGVDDPIAFRFYWLLRFVQLFVGVACITNYRPIERTGSLPNKEKLDYEKIQRKKNFIRRRWLTRTFFRAEAWLVLS